eukprot:Em0053g5a
MDMEPEQEIENRSVRSGASKRKKRKEQLDEWNRLQSKLPRLLSFGFSIQNEPNHSSLQAGTLETAAAEHQCLDVVNNTHDSVNETEPSATMLAPSNDCSQSFQSYTLDTTVTTAAINDPAKWTVTDNLREYWALHGPTRCYNNDGRSKFDEFERRTIGAALVKTYKDVNQRKQHSTRTSILLRCMEGINFE